MTINKRVAISFLTIVGVMSLVVALTVAQFSNNAILENNSMTTGSADLKIADEDNSPGAYGDIIGGFSVTDILPGQSASKEFWLNNNNDLSMDIEAKTKDVTDSSTGEVLKGLVTLTFECDTNLDDTFDFGPTAAASVASMGSTAVSLGTLGADVQPDTGVGADEHHCKMTATLDSSADNDAANANITFDVEFTGTLISP